ncbi:hypothetical protein FHR24_001325 [Wenyingzhuangia heitensis]|uniref:3-keto-alpha-glucoside-1,2-lyase/3-keto-2-hydroxy-glucal hydratase domain-containing protein n=1 Tax=Wenyingzhuangia heitensis TaxID=1487859 RepID=A0ABX0UBE4_9FLAO|nr:DUF1080 domain-containing protein [Wenyingzhuangia heitensis]NIJ44886.1 hypothetical protein [Wenyingzhuangia heitensis]
MKQFVTIIIAVFGFYSGQAQQKNNEKEHHTFDNSYTVDEKIKTALETNSFYGMPSPKDHRATEFYTPVPAKVDPYGQNGVPSDAIVLFDGTNMDEWINQKEQIPCTWKLDKEEKTMTIAKGGKKINATIVTKRKFGAIQLHVEWKSPPAIKSRTGQARGNSGVATDIRYEVQILDNNDNETYVNGMVGSIYKQSAPLVNPSVPTGAWNSYDIIYHPPVFKGTKRMKAATMTVLHNGVLIQDHFSIQGAVAYIGWPRQEVHGKEAIRLQDHGSAVSYRNIWVRELE